MPDPTPVAADLEAAARARNLERAQALSTTEPTKATEPIVKTVPTPDHEPEPAAVADVKPPPTATHIPPTLGAPSPNDLATLGREHALHHARTLAGDKTPKPPRLKHPMAACPHCQTLGETTGHPELGHPDLTIVQCPKCGVVVNNPALGKYTAIEA